MRDAPGDIPVEFGARQRVPEGLHRRPRAVSPEFTYEKKCASEGKTALFLLAKQCVAIHASLVEGAKFPGEAGQVCE
ncbi:MAG: hypothetical protein Kow0074_03940 [Candidatus Zixiibacteriota bacterium]